MTPYTGTNYGDGAIQTATIDNMMKRIPNAEFFGITLAPDRMPDYHGIESVAITGLAVTFYSESLFIKPRLSLSGHTGSTEEQHTLDEAVHRLNIVGKSWRYIKAIPLLGAIAIWLLDKIRDLANVANEIRYLFASAKFLRDKDMIVVSGGGQLDDEWGGAFGHPYALFRWLRLGRLIGVRIVVLSVGVGKLQTRTSLWLTNSALKCASYRSYRDRGSKMLLEDMQVTSEDPVFPDLAFSLDHCSPDRQEQAPTCIAISMIAFGRHECWPTENEAAYLNYLVCMAELVEYLVSRDYRILIIRSSGADQEAIEDLSVMLDERNCTLGDDCFPEMLSLQDLLGALDLCDIVVASRLHSVMLAHHCRRPCLAVSFDRKVDVHMTDFEQDQFCTSIIGVSSASLIEMFSNLAGTCSDSIELLEQHTRRCRTALDSQYDEVFGQEPRNEVSQCNDVNAH